MAAVKRHAWWPTWEADVAYWVSHCWPCQALKQYGKLSHWPNVVRELPTCAFDEVAVDIFGPLPTSAQGHTHIVVFQDVYSRWVELFPLRPAQMTAAGIAEVLVDQYCTRHGVPRTLLSDRGAQFKSALSEAVYKQMGIKKLFTTAFHPQCNGMVERFMRSLAQMLAPVVDGTHSDWACLVKPRGFLLTTLANTLLLELHRFFLHMADYPELRYIRFSEHLQRKLVLIAVGEASDQQWQISYLDSRKPSQ